MENGKQVFYASTGQETDKTFASGLISYVEHYQNGDYLRKLSRDTMRGMINCVKRGLWTCGGPPYGYDRLVLDKTGNPKKIVRDLADRSQLILHPESGQVLETLPPGVRFHKFAGIISVLITIRGPLINVLNGISYPVRLWKIIFWILSNRIY